MDISTIGWVFSVLLLLAVPYEPRSSAPEPTVEYPWRAPGVVFLLIVGTRLTLLYTSFNGWFYADETIAGCIEPLQFSRGEPIWIGTFYASYATFLAGYKLFGFSPEVPRVISLLATAIAGSVFHVATRRIFGARFAWIASIWFVVAAPFILHALYAFQTGLSLIPVAFMVLLLTTNRLDRNRTLWIAPLLTVAMYIYPSAFLACSALLLVHMVLHREVWTRDGHLYAGIGMVMSVLTIVGIRGWYDSMAGGMLPPTHWGGGKFSLTDVPNALHVLFADAFWHSTSFDSLNLGVAYLDPALQGLIVLGLMSGWRDRQPEWRYGVTAFLAFVLTLVFASLSGPNPGIRRAYPALLLLGIPLTQGVRHALRWRQSAFVAFALGLVLCHSEYLVLSWPHYEEPPFVASARETIYEFEYDHVVIIGEDDDQWKGEAWRCPLLLAGHKDDIKVVRRSKLDAWRAEPGWTAVLASRLIPLETLITAFGRAPSSVFFTHDPIERFDRLKVRYVFSG